MIEVSSFQVSGFNPQPSVHSESIDVLSQQILRWYKQIDELDRGDFPDRAIRAAALRKRCHSVTASIKHLEGKEIKS